MINMTQIYNPSYKTTNVEFNSKISVNELNTVPNGSLENIYCDILDTLEISKRTLIQNDILKKIMIGGSIHIKMLNILLLSKAIIKGDIALDDLNSILQSTLSVIDQKYLDEWIFQNSNYIVEKIDISVLHTTVTIKRIR
jgi:hypothetical protein